MAGSRKPRPSGYARAEARNAAARAGLTPLAPGERPPALLVSVAVTAILGVGTLALFAGRVEIDGDRPSVLAVLAFSAAMLVLAAGMWGRNYWAVLVFEALLGLTVALAALALLFASNASAVVVCAAIALAGGWLFWKLVRVMGRLQAPQRMG